MFASVSSFLLLKNEKELPRRSVRVSNMRGF